MASGIYGIVIPKYGMVMTEGRISKWYADLGQQIERGDELVDIETEKVANVYESPHSGILRRKLVAENESAPIGSLFGVIVSPEVKEEAIDAFIRQFENPLLGEERVVEPTAEVIDLPGGHIKVLQKGEDGRVSIILIHGFGADLNSWILNQDALAASYSTYAVDLPGHGGSSKSAGISSLDQLALLVAEFATERRLARVHVVGHSLGGAVAAKMALLRPESVASLTLLAPVGLGKEINAAFINGLVEVERRKEMRTVLQSLFHNPALVNREMTMSVLKAKRIDGAIESLRAIANGCFAGGVQATDICHDLMTLEIPVQIIWGQADKIIPAFHVQNAPSDVDVHVLKNAGHMVHMEKVAEVNRLILKFVDANR